MIEFLKAIWPVGLFACVLMLIIWRLAWRINNLGIIDIAWSGAFAPVALYFAATGHGYPLRRWLIGGIAAFWSLRLGIYIYLRVMGHHPKEDARYAELRKSWGKNLKLRTFLFFQIQAISVVLLAVPFYLPTVNQRPAMLPVEWSGVAIWLLAILGESLADWQLSRFKSNPENRGKICQAGLWNYSRHPNYFFEWLVWVAYFIFALGSPWGVVTLYCPLLMLYFLLMVTGIPLTEKLSVQNRGEAYREYQRTTSPFVPWFKRHGKQKQPA